MKPCILGIAGYCPDKEEREAITRLQPAGYILFARNIDTPAQTATLITELRAITNHDPLIMVDQEGGRVQRLAPPHWRQLPAAAAIGMESAHPLLVDAWAQEVATQFATIGANCCAAPVLDLRHRQGNQVIGDRAYSECPHRVTAVGTRVHDALIARGIIPIIKHIPGHGRARVDSHLTIGEVTSDMDTLAATDLVPFTALRHAPIAMTAHLIYRAIDPLHPFTQSPDAIAWLRTRLGFTGLLVSDCIHMKSLTGSIAKRVHSCLAAGIDLVIDSHSSPATWLASYSDVQLEQPAAQRLRNALQICTADPLPYDRQLARLLDKQPVNTSDDPTGDHHHN